MFILTFEKYLKNNHFIFKKYVIEYILHLKMFYIQGSSFSYIEHF